MLRIRQVYSMPENDLLINLRGYQIIYFITKIENKNLVINLELERVLMDQDDLFLSANFLIDIVIGVLKIKYPKIFHVNYFVPIVLIKNNKLKMYNIFSILAKLTMIIEINLLLIFKIIIMEGNF